MAISAGITPPGENIDEVDIFADLQEQNNNYKISKNGQQSRKRPMRMTTSN
jgi:hypothetical protein